MPNARDIVDETRHQILAIGYAGAGKTSQFLTLPGKKFAYLFDPNAKASLKGYDVEFEEYLPRDLNLDVKSLSKDKKAPKVMSTNSAAVYEEWEKDFEDRIQGGFFADIDWLMVDSFTTLGDLVMDRVLAINGRPDTWPMQDDYGPQMLTLKNITRACTSLGINVYMTAHLELQQDKLSSRVFHTPVLTGKLKSKLPTMFSDLFVFDADTDKDGAGVFRMQTKPTRDNPLVRTSIKGLDLFEDVTLDWNSNEGIEGQGLGGILNWAKKQGGATKK